MCDELGVELVRGEIALAALNDSHILRRHIKDAGALLETPAAAAGYAAFDLGQISLDNEGAAMAVGAVSLGRLLG